MPQNRMRTRNRGWRSADRRDEGRRGRESIKSEWPLRDYILVLLENGSKYRLWWKLAKFWHKSYMLSWRTKKNMRFRRGVDTRSEEREREGSEHCISTAHSITRLKSSSAHGVAEQIRAGDVSPFSILPLRTEEGKGRPNRETAQWKERKQRHRLIRKEHPPINMRLPWSQGGRKGDIEEGKRGIIHRKTAIMGKQRLDSARSFHFSSFLEVRQEEIEKLVSFLEQN